jgi:hypothetical protein
MFAINAEQIMEKHVTRLKKFLEIIDIDQEQHLDQPTPCISETTLFKSSRFITGGIYTNGIESLK